MDKSHYFRLLGDQRPNQIHASRTRETHDERKTTKMLTPFIREREAPGIGRQGNSSQRNCRFRLQERLQTSPSLWPP